ncbi:MAG: 30S ribosomal protein S4 [bacterium]
MKIGPKYKIARRLGAPIFEKTQTQKFAFSKTKAGGKDARRPKAKSEFGRQLIEKQKARFTYGVSERQFSKYVKEIIEKKSPKAGDMLYEVLERRLDNVVARIAVAPTRQAARQVVSHGHILVNGVKVTVPSYQIYKGDVITIREGSQKKTLFTNLAEKINETVPPVWIKADTAKKNWTIVNYPKAEGESLLFDLGSVFEYYRR